MPTRRTAPATDAALTRGTAASDARARHVTRDREAGACSGEDGRRARDDRAELQAWYVARLWPKLDAAARTGAAAPAAVAALDALLREFLDLPDRGDEDGG